jgi:hypothetical protein
MWHNTILPRIHSRVKESPHRGIAGDKQVYSVMGVALSGNRAIEASEGLSEAVAGGAELSRYLRRLPLPYRSVRWLAPPAVKR